MLSRRDRRRRGGSLLGSSGVLFFALRRRWLLFTEERKVGGERVVFYCFQPSHHEPQKEAGGQFISARGKNLRLSMQEKQERREKRK